MEHPGSEYSQELSFVEFLWLAKVAALLQFLSYFAFALLLPSFLASGLSAVVGFVAIIKLNNRHVARRAPGVKPAWNRFGLLVLTCSLGVAILTGIGWLILRSPILWDIVGTLLILYAQYRLYGRYILRRKRSRPPESA
ncbi:MAG: hypothetical protein OWT27_06075 [Firmicutes bacterium]|nr:hypothetical protein [Bacillota bacterium]